MLQKSFSTRLLKFFKLYNIPLLYSFLTLNCSMHFTKSAKSEGGGVAANNVQLLPAEKTYKT